jgi:hypothetical protein
MSMEHWWSDTNYCWTGLQLNFGLCANRTLTAHSFAWLDNTWLYFFLALSATVITISYTTRGCQHKIKNVLTKSVYMGWGVLSMAKLWFCAHRLEVQFGCLRAKGSYEVFAWVKKSYDSHLCIKTKLHLYYYTILRPITVLVSCNILLTIQ